MLLMPPASGLFFSRRLAPVRCPNTVSGQAALPSEVRVFWIDGEVGLAFTFRVKLFCLNAKR